jgi:hypothetical protein
VESAVAGAGVRTGSSAAKAFAFVWTAASTAVLSSGPLDDGGEGAAVAAIGSISGGRRVCVVAKTTAAADAATSRITGTTVSDLAIIARTFRPIVGPLALTELPCADFFRSSSPAGRKFTVRGPEAILRSSPERNCTGDGSRTGPNSMAVVATIHNPLPVLATDDPAHVVRPDNDGSDGRTTGI